jgi:hypothetical protein
VFLAKKKRLYVSSASIGEMEPPCFPLNCSISALVASERDDAPLASMVCARILQKYSIIKAHV